MSQRFYLEPDWQSWNDRIAVPVIPRHMQGKFNYKLYKEKSSQLEFVDKKIEDLLSERTSIVVSIITMQDTAPVQIVKRERKEKAHASASWPIGNLSVDVDKNSEKKKAVFQGFKRVDDYDLNYTADEMAVFSSTIPYEEGIRIRIKRQNSLHKGFIRKVSRFLTWKLNFKYMQAYVSGCGFVVKDGFISIYNKGDDIVIIRKPFYGDGYDCIIAQIQILIEFYYNFEIEGKPREKLVIMPEYVLGLIYKYIINGTADEPISTDLPCETFIKELDPMEDCEDLPCLVNYLTSRLQQPSRTLNWLEEMD